MKKWQWMCCHWICQCLSNFTSDLFLIKQISFLFLSKKSKTFFTIYKQKNVFFVVSARLLKHMLSIYLSIFLVECTYKQSYMCQFFLSFKHAQMLAVHHFWGKKSLLKIVWICHTPVDSFKETMTSLFLVSKHSTVLIHSIKMSNLVKFSFLNICSLRSDNDFSPIFSKGVGNEFLNIS